jgi:hypothetical protein
MVDAVAVARAKQIDGTVPVVVRSRLPEKPAKII